MLAVSVSNETLYAIAAIVFILAVLLWIFGSRPWHR